MEQMSRVIIDVMLDGRYNGTISYELGKNELNVIERGRRELVPDDVSVRKAVVEKYPALRGKAFTTEVSSQRVSSWRW